MRRFFRQRLHLLTALRASCRELLRDGRRLTAAVTLLVFATGLLGLPVEHMELQLGNAASDSTAAPDRTATVSESVAESESASTTERSCCAKRGPSSGACCCSLERQRGGTCCCVATRGKTKSVCGSQRRGTLAASSDLDEEPVTAAFSCPCGKGAATWISVWAEPRLINQPVGLAAPDGLRERLSLPKFRPSRPVDLPETPPPRPRVA